MASRKTGERMRHDTPEPRMWDGRCKVLNPFNIGVDPGIDAEGVADGKSVDPKPEKVNAPEDPRWKGGKRRRG